MGGTTGSASVFFTTSDGTATTNGIHYTNVAATLNFPQGETFVATNISIVDDQIVNADRYVNLTLSNFVGAAPGGQTNALLTIVNDDGRIGFSAPTYNVSEVVPSGSATITVLRNGGATGQVAVQFATTTNGTAAPNQRFTPVSGTLVFAPGETNKTFSVPIIDDLLLNGNQTIELVLTNLTGNAVPGQMTALLTIIDNDVAPGVFNFERGNYVTNESDTIVLAQITVTRTNGSTGVVSVDYRTGNGTAIAGQDYLTSIGTLSFADGETFKTFTVPILPDTVQETNETVFLDLLNPTGGATIGFQNSAILTIVNNDILIFGNLVFSSATYTNREDDGAAVITVRRIGGTTGSIGVSYATTNTGTAIPGFHYTPASGSLTWGDGDASPRSFVIPLFNNTIVDGNRTVDLVLLNPTNGASLNIPSLATLTILDDDSAPGVLGFSAPIFNVLESASNAVITVTRTNGFTGSVSVQYATFTNVNDGAVAYSGGVDLDGTLDNGFDPGSIVFGTNAGIVRAVGVYTNGVNANKVVIGGLFTLVGNASRTNVARLNSDGTPDTTFDPGTGVNNAVNSVAIQNNGRVLLGGTFTAVNGTNRNFIARLNFDGSLDTTFSAGGGPDAQVRVVVPLNDGTVLIAGDFDSVAGVPNRRVARLNADGSPDSSFISRGMITNGAIYSMVLQINGQILIGGTFTATNGAGAVRVNVARLNADGTLDPTFDPATGPDDFVDALAVQPDGKIIVGGAFANFAGYSRSRLARLDLNGGVDPTINIGTGADNLVAALALQNDGKILVGGAFTSFNRVPQNHFTRLHGGQNYGAGLVVFGASQFTVSEAGTNAIISVLRTGGTSNFVSVDYSVIAGGTAVPGVDYLPVGGTLFFGQGETLRTFVLPIIDDTLVKPDRTVFLTLSNVTGGAALDIPPTAVLTITENDSQLSFSSGAFSVAENGTNAVVTVVRLGGTNELVFVDYFTAGITATPLLDFTNVSGTLTFLPGVSTQTFLVPVVDDILVEGSETVALFLTNAGPIGIAAVGGVTNSTLTIVDNDFGVGVLGFAATNFNALENAGFAVITVVRTNGSSGAVTVTFATVDGVGNATPGVDYLSTNGILTFGDGETSKTFNVPIIDDPLVEGPETVALQLVATTGGAGLGLTNATMTIVDDDSYGTFQFSTNSYFVSESVGSVTVTVLRTGGTVGAVSVDFATVGGTATPGVDYFPVAQVLRFAQGQSSSNVTVQIINDQIVEPQESIGLILTNATAGAVLGSLTNSTILIADDDMQFSFIQT
ncbi:MAG: hypothetical protein EB082_10245, partial [Verrucomicrobia bacterium]|nr:hypothetical protein [Verrucomicrobiota bacterium]